MNNCATIGMLLISVAFPLATRGQDWVTERVGAASNDEGRRVGAIVRSQIIDVGRSDASFNGQSIAYVHPACFDITRQGTTLIGFNGGLSEGKGNKAYVMRRPEGGSWSEPKVLEDDQQIDFGVIYQPRNIQDAPLLAHFWYGGAPVSGAPAGIRVSFDDGQSWSKRTLAPKSDLWAAGRMQTGMNHPLEKPDGSLWFLDTDHRAKPPSARIIKVPAGNYSNDGGSEWTARNVQGKQKSSNVHGTWLVLSPDQSDLMGIWRRDFNRGAFYRRSTDSGDSWGDWVKIDMKPHPTNGISAVSLDWSNPTSRLHGWHVIAGSQHGVARTVWAYAYGTRLRCDI